MRRVVIGALMAALSLGATAHAQSDLSSVAAIASGVYASCSALSEREGLSDPRAACACLTGYMGGAMSDRDFEVASVLLRVGEMEESGASEIAIEAEIMAFFERGFTEDDVTRVAAMVDAISARGDALCGQFERRDSV